MLIYSPSYDSLEISKIFIDENERADILNESLNDEKFKDHIIEELYQEIFESDDKI